MLFQKLEKTNFWSIFIGKCLYRYTFNAIKHTILKIPQVFLIETCHTIGLALLAYVILPELDVVKGAMLANCMCFIPGLLRLLCRGPKESKKYLKMIVDITAIAAQVTGFIAWPLVENESKLSLWLIPVASIFISASWWENYVSKNSPLGEFPN
jgi:chitin synthase